MKEYGSEFSESIIQDSYFSYLTKKVKDFAFFRSGRESLFFLAKHLELKNSDTILLPAYCCDSMIDPFRKMGVKVLFYKLNKNTIE